MRIVCSIFPRDRNVIMFNPIYSACARQLLSMNICICSNFTYAAQSKHSTQLITNAWRSLLNRSRSVCNLLFLLLVDVFIRRWLKAQETIAFVYAYRLHGLIQQFILWLQNMRCRHKRMWSKRRWQETSELIYDHFQSVLANYVWIAIWLKARHVVGTFHALSGSRVIVWVHVFRESSFSIKIYFRP